MVAARGASGRFTDVAGLAPGAGATKAEPRAVRAKADNATIPGGLMWQSRPAIQSSFAWASMPNAPCAELARLGHVSIELAFNDYRAAIRIEATFHDAAMPERKPLSVEGG